MPFGGVEISHLLYFTSHSSLSISFAQQLAATSFMRHFIFYDAHEKVMKTKSSPLGEKGQMMKRRSSMSTRIAPVNGPKLQRDRTLATSLWPGSSGGDQGSVEISEEVSLPYREGKDRSRSRDRRGSSGLSDLDFLQSLRNAPENVLGSLILTGMLTAEDVSEWTEEYQFKFDNATTFELCKHGVKDLTADQEVSILTTDEKKLVELSAMKKLKKWKSSARLTSAIFTSIDLICITMTFFEDHSQAPKGMIRMHHVYKFTSVAVWLFLLFARNVYTEDACERMQCILEIISKENDMRMVDVAMSHVGFCLSYNLSKCSVFYLYGRGGPGLITTGMFLFSILYLQQETEETEEMGTAKSSTQSMALVTISAMILSFITALSYSKAKLFNLYSTQSKSSLDHLNSLFQTNLTKASMDKISDPDFMVEVLSDPDFVQLSDLVEEDSGREFLKKELDMCTKTLVGLDHSAGSLNKYQATFRAPGESKRETRDHSNSMTGSFKKSTNRKYGSARGSSARRKTTVLTQGEEPEMRNQRTKNGHLFRTGISSHRSSLKKRNSASTLNGHGNDIDHVQAKLAGLLKEDRESNAEGVAATEADIVKKMNALLSESKGGGGSNPYSSAGF